MAITNFIPQIWAARLLSHLDKSHVLSNLVNRNYEGEIRNYGDTVKITSIGDITVKPYTENTDMDAPEMLNTTQQTLTIDQQMYFNFQIDDVDAAQMRSPLMDAATQRAAYSLNDRSDKWLAEKMVNGAAEANLLGTTTAPVSVTDSTLYDYITRMRVILDKRNVPTEGRWLLVPPEAHGLLLQDDRFVKTGGAMAENILRNGYVGSVSGFNVYTSNNLPGSLGRYPIIASNNTTTTYAEQIIKTEAYRMERRFADGLKGLHVYGAKVIRSAGIVVLQAAFDSGILAVLTLVSAAGSASGKTKVTVDTALPSGYTAKYKTASSVTLPQYDDVCTTGWSSFTADTDITATTGNELAVVYVNSDSKAKAAGKITVVSAT